MDSAIPNLELWDQAVARFRADAYAEACPLLSEWLAKAEAEGLQSKGAAMNLTVCSAKLERWDQAVLAIHRANTWEPLPWNRFLLLQNTEKIQEKIGIQDASFEISNQLRWIFPDSQLAMAASIGWWGSLIPIVLLIKKLKLNRAALWSGFGFFATLFVTAATLFGIGRFAFPALVLTGEEKEIAVYSKPQAIEENLLVALPRGTVVFTKELTPTDPTAPIPIARPVAGWVSRDKLTVLGD
jgi:hypothetical protein